MFIYLFFLFLDFWWFENFVGERMIFVVRDEGIKGYLLIVRVSLVSLVY